MIKNKRDLANILDENGTIEINNVSKKLNRIINLWISRNEIRKENNLLIGNF